MTMEFSDVFTGGRILIDRKLSDDQDADEVPTATVWVWIGLTIIAAVSFWTQATVTEERFVPALNVIADVFKIPSDIAGATLMAAGASSPELFSSFVSLFITHSSLGLGTIVGSEVFNQLIICAGAVFASKGGRLELDPPVVIREVGFYALSVILLCVALRDTGPLPDDPTGPDHIFISFWESLMVFGGYIAYVAVCANMESIVHMVTGKHWTSAEGGDFAEDSAPVRSNPNTSMRTSIIKVDETTPFLRDKSTFSSDVEPSGYQAVSFYQTKTGEKANETVAGTFSKMESQSSSFAEIIEEGGTKENVSQPKSSLLENSIRQVYTSHFSDGGQFRMFDFIMQSSRPSDEHSLHDVELNVFEERMSCFLWQRSYFYNKAKFAKNGWFLRWFTFTRDRAYSVPDRANFEKHKMGYPIFEEITVDPDHLIIRITNPVIGKRNFYFMAPSEKVFDFVVKKMELMIDINKKKKQDEGSARALSTDGIDDIVDNFEPESLIEFPVGASNVGIVFYFLLFPLRFLMHYTVPDVRTTDRKGNPNSSLTTTFIAISMCLVWLIVGSYAMVASLEALAALMDIPDAVVGVTVSAAGTSLPNYVASKVAAEKGFGNMAVSNAFGSNTFNIMIGLGLPWVLYTSFGTHFQPYHDLLNDGILESVIIMLVILFMFIVLVFPTGFVIYKWHGYLFIFLYVGYLAFAIGQVYWPH